MSDVTPPNAASAPNYQQIAGALKILVPVLLAMVGERLIPKDTIAPLTDQIINGTLAAITLGAITWSAFRNSKVGQIAAVAKLDEVQLVVAAPHIADQALATEPKVVSTLPTLKRST